ncbi:BON domain-containing protein [Humidesulfovibrio sp.]
MEQNAPHARNIFARLPRPAIWAALGLWLFCAGGCAMLPFAITTGASLAMPPTASLAMSGVKGAYNTAIIASDERDINTMVRDNMLTLKAKSALIAAEGGSEVEVLALNGDLFAVGSVATLAERDEIINAMRQVPGVGDVKGHLRLRDPETSPSLSADDSLENSARRALSRHLLHKNAGVEVEAVEGELCLMGVVGTHAEALDLIQYLESVTNARVMSLLAIRNEYATGRTETNRLYLLAPGDADPLGTLRLHEDAPALPWGAISLAQTGPAPEVHAASTALASPLATVARRTAPGEYRAAVTRPAIASARPQVAPAQAAAPAVNKVRAQMQQKLISLAKREHNPQAQAELLTLANQVAQDRDVSISDRLSVAAAQATQLQAKAQIEKLLALY